MSSQSIGLRRDAGVFNQKSRKIRSVGHQRGVYSLFPGPPGLAVSYCKPAWSISFCHRFLWLNPTIGGAIYQCEIKRKDAVYEGNNHRSGWRNWSIALRKIAGMGGEAFLIGRKIEPLKEVAELYGWGCAACDASDWNQLDQHFSTAEGVLGGLTAP